MKKKATVLIASIMAFCGINTAHADEGMWTIYNLPNAVYEMMQREGFSMTYDQLYNGENALKNAVVNFSGYCSGVVVSPDGLVFTNHHCGFEAIRSHSTVEHDYMLNGFFAKSYAEELPNENMFVSFMVEQKDVTDKVMSLGYEKLDNKKRDELIDSLENEMTKEAKKNDSTLHITVQPFYEGNKWYATTYRDFTDLRLVFTVPKSMGKFGGDTDNWMWPRHTCDFSVFRIYADANGEPAEYNENNVPLKAKKHLAISLKGINEGDYAMIMGFPGSTNRYLTQSEVKQRMHSTNEPRIRIRGVRQDVLKKEMAASDKVRIQYASKYAGSSNYWKNSIGMNKAIIDNKVLETKAEQEAKFAAFAKAKGNTDYEKVVNEIDAAIEKSNPILYNYTCFREVFQGGIEFGTPYLILDKLKDAIKNKDKEAINKNIETLKKVYADIHNKDYDHEVDRKVAKALLPLYAEMVPADALPAFYTTIQKDFKGNYDAYVDHCYDNSIFSNEANFNKFIKKPTVKAIEKDPMTAYVRAKYDLMDKLGNELAESMKGMDLLHKTYVRGLCEMYSPKPKAPDANFTIRLTYGNVKSYNPKDGVHYKYYTTLKGVMEKEDPTNPEFVVPAKLKELYEAKDFGRYALPNGDMPACFLTTNDITGGNSGSPVINGNGELIGAAFDGNWESLSGDINFDNNLQRCIAVDIRYVLFIIDKLGGCKHLIDEMTIVE